MWRSSRHSLKTAASTSCWLLVDFHLENGTDALLTLGTTGESSTMSHEEDDEVCKFVVESVWLETRRARYRGQRLEQYADHARKEPELPEDGGRWPAAHHAGTTTSRTKRASTVISPRCSMRLIFPGILVGKRAWSYGVLYFREECRAPGEKHPNAFGIKEASGNIGYATKIARYLSDDFCMFSGNDDIVLPMMALGSRGVISVWANVQPKEVHDMCHAWLVVVERMLPH